MLSDSVLVMSTGSNLSGIEASGVITIVWAVPNSGTTTRTFQTTVSCAANGGNPGPASVFTTTLTVLYTPAGLCGGGRWR